MEELFEKVKAWGRERKINNPHRQLNKVTEEVGELAHEICRDHYGAEFRDSIGDTMVTLIILADMTGADPLECLQEAYNEIDRMYNFESLGTFLEEVKSELNER